MSHKKNSNYYLGLDIGTNSVGYAVTDEHYNIIKHGGEPMWGSHIFEEGKHTADRRAHRTSRHRNDRRKQRVQLISEIFASEISKVDERFFIRRRESGIFRNEVDEKDRYIMFSDERYTDKDFFNAYPTIHHLICELMTSTGPHDVRLVYIACAYLVAHRGHFLIEVNKDNVEEVMNFDRIYNDFMYSIENCGYMRPWNCNVEDFKNILSKKSTRSDKEKRFLGLLNGGKKFKLSEDDEMDLNGLIKLLCGGSYELFKLFPKLELEKGISVDFKKSEEEFESAISTLGEEADILASMKNLYDWTILSAICKEENGYCISKDKVDVYEQHKKDLEYLKKIIKKYKPKKYNEVFKKYNKDTANYVLYSYNFKSVNGKYKSEDKTQKVSSEQFCKYINSIIKDITVDETDRADYEEMKNRISENTFMPKQVEGNNRIIPYQLYYYELKKILDNAKEYLPFLLDKDEDGYRNIDKILSVMEFRISYYVGPLRKDNGQHGWIERKAGGKIYPWNFEEKVDLEKSEKAFIDRMTNSCTYVAGEKVLPKYSLLYCSYTVLNEINNIRINGEPIPVEHKQGLYRLFEKYNKVSVKKIREYLEANKLLHNEDVLSGLDVNVKSSLKSYRDFKKMIESGVINEYQAEQIIETLTYCEEKSRIVNWLNNNYPNLTESDVKYISKLKYNDFGRLSKKLLAGIEGCSKNSGETFTIIRALWETNDNLNQLLSDKYTFSEEIERIRNEYYQVNPASIDSLMDEMYINNSVKRSIYRTLDIVNDVKNTFTNAPKRIFVEVTRGDGTKGKRSKSRRDQIKELYSKIDCQEIRELSSQLDGLDDNELQREVLFLYFMQLGRSAYSDTVLDIDKLKSSAHLYNIDHIYPQCITSDNSMDNKVLVLSEENKDKGDEYPIKSEIQNKMHAYWQTLLKNKLISDEKYKRLTRKSTFKEEELQGFINRQLVETGQAAKATAMILKSLFPNTEIVYVKSHLVSEFRKKYEMLKTRSINDNHHAKDAYLNIVVGNVYHCRFTKNFYINQKYSLKTATLFKGIVEDGQDVIWNGENDLPKVKKVMSKNNIHYTRYSFIRKGGLFDQNPLKARENLIPRKKGLDSAKYGGYSATKAAAFILVKYKEDKKTTVMIMPIELMYFDLFFRDEGFAKTYTKNMIESIWDTQTRVSEIEFPLGKRVLKINTILSFDGFKACIASKSNRGQVISLTPMMPLIIGNEWERYVKKLDSFSAKKEKNPNIKLDEKNDGICIEKNIKLYEILSSKVIEGVYNIPFSSQVKILDEGRYKFEKLSLEQQVHSLRAIILLLQSGKDVNLKIIGGNSSAGSYTISSKINNWKKNFKNVHIVDISASGIYESKSFNLLELI